MPLYLKGTHLGIVLGLLGFFLDILFLLLNDLLGFLLSLVD